MEEMNEKLEGRIQAEDKKAGGRFAVILVGAMIIGGVVGFFGTFFAAYLSKNELSIMGLWEQISPAVAFGAAIVMFAAAIVMNLVCWLRISKHLKKLQEWDGEDETEIEKTEGQINYDILCLNIMTLGEFLLFGLALNNLVRLLEHNFVIPVLVIVVFLLSSVSQTVMQQKIVNQYKKQNPEKKGSVFDLKFDAKWYESCDEAERALIGRAAKKALGTVSATCLVLEILLLFASMLLGVGVLAHIVVVVIWLVSTVAYMTEAIKISK